MTLILFCATLAAIAYAALIRYHELHDAGSPYNPHKQSRPTSRYRAARFRVAASPRLFGDK